MTRADSAPIAGLPGPLPAGERLLWQGAPDWRSLAVRAFHVRKVAVYFGLLACWQFAVALADGATLARAAAIAAGFLPVAAIAVGLLAALAFRAARTTVYSITSRRVVLRYGMALPMALNLPFTKIADAGLKRHRDGTGDLPIALVPPDRIPYPVLWPHARPWHLSRPEPMLRSIADPERVAAILADAHAAVTRPDSAPSLTATAPTISPDAPRLAAAAF